MFVLVVFDLLKRKFFFLLLIFYIFFGPNLRLNVCEKLVISPKMFIISQGESVLYNFAERAPMSKGIENPEKEELRG